MFRLGKEGAHSGERSARCDPPVFVVPGGKMSLQVASAAVVYVYNMSRRKKRQERRWWQTELYRRRSAYSGTNCKQILSAKNFVDGTKKIYSNGTSRF